MKSRSSGGCIRRTELGQGEAIAARRPSGYNFLHHLGFAAALVVGNGLIRTANSLKMGGKECTLWKR